MENLGFLCSCDLCENDVDIEAETFEAFIQEAKKLFIDRQSILKAQGIFLEATRCYSIEKCKRNYVLQTTVQSWKRP